MPFLHSKPGRRSNEDVFFAYYSRLLEWALQITRNDHSEAEDLVHDFYLRVTRIAKSIDEMEQLEHYLFKVLRNLYHSRLRRAGRVPLNEISLVDYDSVEQGLAVADRRELFFARTHLRQICRYACERKSTARSASILILRFFHGYYPIEVMKILHASRFSVDRSLQVARNEARLYRERPDVLRSISPGRKLPVSFSGKGEETQQLFFELQEAVFSAVEGECFDPVALEQRYAPQGEQSGMTTKELSHLVSCRVCLDRVNSILQLPLLAERSPEDSIDRDNSSGSGGESGSGITEMPKRISKKGPPIRKLERRARELFEHRPASLEIVVDGDLRSSQKVTAEINELQLKLGRKEEPAFIEVLSEQGFCLVFLQVDEPTTAKDLEQVESTYLSDDRSLILTLRFAAEGPVVHVVYRDPVASKVASEEDCFVEGQYRNTADISSATTGGPLAHAAAWLSSLSSKIKRTLPDMNPTLATALVLAVSSVVCFFLWWHQPPTISANAFMVRAEKWDSAPQNPANPGVIYQKVQIKTHKRIINRGIYRDAQGIRTLRHQELAKEDVLLKDKLAGADVDWNEPLSAGNYQDWHDQQRVREDSIARAGSHLLALTTRVPDGPVAEQTLTVRDFDFHPIERTIRFRDDEQVEIAELSYEELPWSRVDPNLFNLIAPAGGLSSLQSLPQPSLPLKVFTKPTEGQIDEAELAARLALNQMHADTGEQIEIVRDSDGILVKGIVETEQRRQELDDRLRILPHVTTMLASLERMRREQPQGVDSSTGLKVASVQAQTTPLATYYLAHGRSVVLLDELTRRLLSSADAIYSESRAIDDLQRRFTHRDGISVVASATLSDLLFTHKHKLLMALDDEENLLAEAQIETRRANANAAVDAGDLVLAALAQHNLALARELTLSNGGSGRSAESIAAELAVSIDVLYRQAHAAQIVPQNSTKLDTKK